MKNVSRRDFLKTGAAAAAATVALPLLSRAWYALPGAEEGGYFEREFGITDELCRKILADALARGGDFADLYFERTLSNYLILEDGKVSRAYSDVALGAGIRTVKGDQVGYGFTQELGEKPMLAAAATAATIASGSGPAVNGPFTPLKLADYYPLRTLFSDVPLESKLPLVQKVNSRCFPVPRRVPGHRSAPRPAERFSSSYLAHGVKGRDSNRGPPGPAHVRRREDGKRERSLLDTAAFRSRRDTLLHAGNCDVRSPRYIGTGTADPSRAIQPPAVKNAGSGPAATSGASRRGNRQEGRPIPPMRRSRAQAWEPISSGKERAYVASGWQSLRRKGRREASFVTIVRTGGTPNCPRSMKRRTTEGTRQRTILVRKGSDKTSTTELGQRPTGILADRGTAARQELPALPSPGASNTLPGGRSSADARGRRPKPPARQLVTWRRQPTAKSENRTKRRLQLSSVSQAPVDYQVS